MKGMHLTVDSWQPSRAEDGFKMMDKEIQALEYNCWGSGGLPCRREDEDGLDGMPAAQAPEEGVVPAMVEPVFRYLRDLECLTKLTTTQEPPCQLYHAQRQLASFVVEDASGKGKGNVVIEQYGVDYKLGAWNLEWREKSSNCMDADRSTEAVGSQRISGRPRGIPDHRQLLL